MQKVGGSGDFSVHWAMPDATTVKLAAQAQTEGWISLGESGSPFGGMVGSQVVQGSSEGVRSVQLNSYSADSFVEVSIPGVSANDVIYSGAGGTAVIEYSRAVEGGIDLSVPVPMIAAHHSSTDMDAYHSTNRFSFKVMQMPPPPPPPCIYLFISICPCHDDQLITITPS